MSRAIPPEHDFTKTWDGWELTVMHVAVKFKVIRFLGRGEYDRREFNTLRKAIDNASPDKRALVYAITATERHVQVPRKRWNEFLRLRGEAEVETST